MKEKILNAIQHVRSKCEKRVTLQRIYSFVNKGALFLGSNSFQDFMVGLEIVGYISKRGKGKSAHIFLERNLLTAAVLKRMKTQVMGNISIAKCTIFFLSND